MKYFLPESDDLVDPDYDFLSDANSPKRSEIGNQIHDVYPHEIFSPSPYDGLLVTKSNINSNLEEKIIQLGGIHKYLRIPKKIPIMGDCGAFQFIDKESPPYTGKEILDYYAKLGFDYGITLDHVIVGMDLGYDEKSIFGEFKKEPTEDMKHRFRITIRNAKSMLKMHKKRGDQFKLIGAVQGWSPQSYHKGIKELIKVGFDYIGIGGIAKERSDNNIRLLLKEIRQSVINSGVKVHILGRPPFNVGKRSTSFLDDYLQTHITSFDTSASLMKGLKSGDYYLDNNIYSVARIPQVYGNPSPKVHKILRPFKENKDTKGYEKERKRLHKFELKAFKAIHDYSHKKLNLSKTIKALIAYGDQFDGFEKYYEGITKTLTDRPWEKCPCPICKQIGIEVVIMRCNNRNRRRGFHNTWVFYNQFKKAVGRK